MNRCILSLVALFAVATPAFAVDLTIDVWYGDHQRFGHLGGHPQRWINVLGHVAPTASLASLHFALNDAEARPLSFREDYKRIARDGDFNIEIARTDLRPGVNTVRIVASATDGTRTERMVTVDYAPQDGAWTLPYTIDWSRAKRIADVAQVVDGQWELTPQGVRSVARYYDRVLAFGDASWRDYEVTTTVTVHALTPPKQDPNRTNVTHAAIALRWPGHDADGQQPSVKWYPVGATAEFRLEGGLRECRWRVFDDKREFRVEEERRRVLAFETPYRMKHRVETLPDGTSRYRVKLWPADAPEPEAWDLERVEPDDLECGSALLIAHHSNVTFGNVVVIPL